MIRAHLRPRLGDSCNLPTRTTPRTLVTALPRRGKQANLNQCAPLSVCTVTDSSPDLTGSSFLMNAKMAPDAERLVKTAPGACDCGRSKDVPNALYLPSEAVRACRRASSVA